MLHTEPSFSVYADEGEFLDDKKRDFKVKKDREFTFVDDKEGTLSQFENLGIGDEDEKIETVSSKMNLDEGLEVDGTANGAESKPESFDESEDVEEYYKKMVNEDPLNPLFLKNYAQFLQSNGDLIGAEEYYFLASEAGPKDGGILMQYAKLVWELHHDQSRALSYFESAALAAPQDCDVLAAYASFLWEIDEDEDNDETTARDALVRRTLEVEESVNLETGLGVKVDFAIGMEEYHKQMVLEKPCDSLVLGNYARFLQETKGDFQGAEEYYSRAILASLGDGKVISQYAQLVWELHHDQDQASSYFERAVEAAPTDSHVLGAYAKFLWEAEDQEDKEEDEIQLEEKSVVK